ncbi:MAG: hypothetical protein M0O99_03840 [Desulfuromonas thiophila]|nr:hypothetical protein [Desulfuromonas thiophila]
MGVSSQEKRTNEKTPPNVVPGGAQLFPYTPIFTAVNENPQPVTLFLLRPETHVIT